MWHLSLTVWHHHSPKRPKCSDLGIPNATAAARMDEAKRPDNDDGAGILHLVCSSHCLQHLAVVAMDGVVVVVAQGQGVGDVTGVDARCSKPTVR